MNKKKILVLTDHMPWGHRSIAKAIFNYLKENEKENDYEVVYAEIKAETGFGDDLYTLAYRYIPASNRLAHRVFDKKFARDLVNKSSIFNLPRLKKEINKIKPDLIISAYFFHSHSLVNWRKKEKKNFKLWTVVADPWTINPISFVKGCDLNIVYDEVGVNFAKKYDIKENEIFKTGWWVRPEMYKSFNKKEVRKKLGINDDRPVIFVGGGSLGTNSLTKLLPTLLFIKKKVAFVINTGTDKFVYRMVENYIKILARLRKDDIVYIKNMGWIDNMAEVLGACDIVFGKAGPNFLFDCVACQKPFVAITHIGGQEDGNIDLIKKKKLGWIREKSGRLVNFLYQYLDDPKYFKNKFKETIKKEAQNNEKSLKIILDRVKKDLK
ncbi:MAG: glycosyltransferase [Candidatus Shapirobacteria bacterium]|jgi:UDP-N-acetylglucosamine:LPS N-acetylglucosamine transferase|nr:glycosyltransferase [Candidatus Shapirobacteria bacterium]